MKKYCTAGINNKQKNYLRSNGTHFLHCIKEKKYYYEVNQNTYIVISSYNLI